MQAIILCGGQGTRIRDVADDIPKPLVPIGPYPILRHIMKGYRASGVHDFVLALGYKGHAIKRYFLDDALHQADFTIDLADPDQIEIHRRPDIESGKLTFVDTGLTSMTGARLKRVEHLIHGDHVCLTYGDGVADLDIQELIAFHKDHGRIATVTAVRPPSRFGELELDGSHVRGFAEKPSVPRGWVSGGFFVFKRDIFDWVSAEPECVLESHILPKMTIAGEMMAYRHEGFWHPMDSSADHRALNAMWDAGLAPWSQTWQVSARDDNQVRTRRHQRVR